MSLRSEYVLLCVVAELCVTLEVLLCLCTYRLPFPIAISATHSTPHIMSRSRSNWLHSTFRVCVYVCAIAADSLRELCARLRHTKTALHSEFYLASSLLQEKSRMKELNTNKWRRKYCDAKEEGTRMHLGKLQLVSSTFADDRMLLLRLHLLFDNNNCAISKPWTDARAAFIASIAYLFPSQPILCMCCGCCCYALKMKSTIAQRRTVRTTSRSRRDAKESNKKKRKILPFESLHELMHMKRIERSLVRIPNGMWNKTRSNKNVAIPSVVVAAMVMVEMCGTAKIAMPSSTERMPSVCVSLGVQSIFSFSFFSFFAWLSFTLLRFATIRHGNTLASGQKFVQRQMILCAAGKQELRRQQHHVSRVEQ